MYIECLGVVGTAQLVADEVSVTGGDPQANPEPSEWGPWDSATAGRCHLPVLGHSFHQSGGGGEHKGCHRCPFR
jgi:hypothetical protein